MGRISSLVYYDCDDGGHRLTGYRSKSIIVFILPLVIYANTLYAGFVFDDHEALESNSDVRFNTPLWKVFSNDYWGLPLSNPESHQSYRPLTVLTFRWNRQLLGFEPMWYHLVNMVLHFAVSILYHMLLHSSGFSSETTYAATLLFAVHPIHTEAVANVAGRAELISSTGFLASILASQQSDKIIDLADQMSLGSILWLLVSLLFGLIAMLGKEQGITCLAVSMTQFMFSGKHKKNKFIFVAVQGIGALIIVGARFFLIGGGKPQFVESDNPASFSPFFQTRLLTYMYLCSLNFWKLLCPSQLCFDWSMGSIPLLESIMDLRNLATFVFLLVTATFGIFSLAHAFISTKNETATSSSRNLTLAIALLTLPFMPATNLILPVGFVVAERILYLPSMGYCLLVAMGYSKLNSHFNSSMGVRSNKVYLQKEFQVNEDNVQKKGLWKIGRKVLTLIGYLLVITMAIKTWDRNRDWQDTHSLAKSALKINPLNAKVHFTMGNVLAQQGQRSCEAYYREAIRLRPNYALAWINLGLVLINTGREEEGEECYLRAISIKHDHVTANMNLGHLCRVQHRWREALKHYHIAVSRRPNNPQLHYHIGIVLLHLNDRHQAEHEFRSALMLMPSYPEANMALGKLLATAGNRDELTTDHTAIQEATQRIQSALPYLSNVEPEVFILLARLLSAEHESLQAQAILKKGIKLHPSNEHLKKLLLAI